MNVLKLIIYSVISIHHLVAISLFTYYTRKNKHNAFVAEQYRYKFRFLTGWNMVNIEVYKNINGLILFFFLGMSAFLLGFIKLKYYNEHILQSCRAFRLHTGKIEWIFEIRESLSYHSSSCVCGCGVLDGVHHRYGTDISEDVHRGVTAIFELFRTSVDSSFAYCGGFRSEKYADAKFSVHAHWCGTISNCVCYNVSIYTKYSNYTEYKLLYTYKLNWLHNNWIFT